MHNLKIKSGQLIQPTYFLTQIELINLIQDQLTRKLPHTPNANQLGKSMIVFHSSQISEKVPINTKNSQIINLLYSAKSTQN